jgi:hypothetical protein
MDPQLGAIKNLRLYMRKKAIFQCPHCPHCGQGLVGGHGLGQDFSQCPLFLHWKQASEGYLPGLLGGF